MKQCLSLSVLVWSCWTLSFVSGCDSIDLSVLFVTPTSSEASKTQTVTLSDDTKIIVNNNNGSTQIKVDSSATKATIKITRIAFAQDQTTADTLLDNIAVTVTSPTTTANTLTISAPNPDGATDDQNNFATDLSDDVMDVTGLLIGQQVAVVRLVITLPSGYDVKVVQKNGVIRATGLDSTSVLAVTNGQVKVLESAGNVTAQVADGQVEVSDHEGSLDAAVENGTITIDVLSLSSSEEIIATATNGQIALSIPQDLDADLTAQVDEGTVSFSKGDYSAVSSVKQTLYSVTATLNGGGPTIDLQTANGLITIEGE